MIKVLILNDVLAKGGKERRIVELLKYSKQHFDISFELIFMYEGIDYPEIHDINFPIHIINWTNKKSRIGFKKILSIARTFKPDIIHSWASMTDIIAIFLKLYTRKKFVSSMIADALPFRSYQNKDYFRSRISFPLADVITSNTKAGLISYKAPVAKSVCIYNGFNFDRISSTQDIEQIREKFELKGKFVIGMVAAFEERKDYKTLITAAKSILKKHPLNVTFLLIGAGTDLDDMILYAGEYAHKEIIFTGLINNVEKYIGTFDVGVLCTNNSVHGEGISNAIMECMALSKPVIATSGGGTAEIVVDKETGFIIPPNSPELLEEKIFYFKNNEAEAKKMGNLGFQRIKHHFSIKAMCDHFFDIYKKLK